MSFDQIQLLKAAQKGIEAEFWSNPNVHAVGLGPKIVGGKVTDDWAVVVTVQHKIGEMKLRLTRQKIIPNITDEGILTDIEEGGPYPVIPPPAFGTGAERRKRMRPAPGGCSIGGAGVTAGTLGMNVIDNKTGKRATLSNNHVLANVDKNPPGTAVYQPGIYDGATPADMLNVLLRAVPIKFAKPPNFEQPSMIVDAALSGNGNDADLDPSILDIGIVKEIVDVNANPYAYSNNQIQRSSRTTFYTGGTFKTFNTSVKVLYEDNPDPSLRKIACFLYQIVCNTDCQGGDSGDIGCLVLGASAPIKAFGLFFAANPAQRTGIANPLPEVFKQLDISLITEGPPPPPPDDIVKVDLTVTGLLRGEKWDMNKVTDGWAADVPLTSGSYELKATATSRSGETGTSTIHITVKGGAVQVVKVKFIQPQEGAELSEGTIQVKVSAEYEG
jgi:hypothetical protein